MKLIEDVQTNWSAAVELHPPLADAVGDGTDESLGVYFFERVYFLFPIIFSYEQYVNNVIFTMNDHENINRMVKKNFQTIKDLVSLKQ